jgi:hypothetical protein
VTNLHNWLIESLLEILLNSKSCTTFSQPIPLSFDSISIFLYSERRLVKSLNSDLLPILRQFTPYCSSIDLIDEFPARPTEYSCHKPVTLIKSLLILNDGRRVELAVFAEEIKGEETEEGGRMTNGC